MMPLVFLGVLLVAAFCTGISLVLRNMVMVGWLSYVFFINAAITIILAVIFYAMYL